MTRANQISGRAYLTNGRAIGGSAIPDSVDSHIRAQDYDDANNKYVAQIGPDVPDVRGDPTTTTETINGTEQIVVEYSGDASQTTQLSDSTDPVAFVFVGRSTTDDDNGIPIDGGSSLELAMNDDNGGDGWKLFRESGTGNLGSSDTSYHIYSLIGRNGNEIELRIDGQQVISLQSLDSTTVTGLSIGDRGDMSGNNPDDLRHVESTRLNNFASGDVESEEQRLSDKYGFSL